MSQTEKDLTEEVSFLRLVLASTAAERDRLRAQLAAAEGYADGVPVSTEPAEPAKAGDPVNHPAHYTAGGIEAIDAIEAAVTGLSGDQAYNTGTAIKYLWRWSRKGGAEDLRKARWYIDRLLAGLGVDAG